MGTSNVQQHAVLQAIHSRKRFLLSSHARPDGDALGSLLGLRLILLGMGKQADILVNGEVPPHYRYLPGSETVGLTETVPPTPSWDAAILLECSSFGRTHIRGWQDCFSINIDHHYTGRPFADVNWIDPDACATAEMIYHLACSAGITINEPVATCLYTGILADTGSFSFPNTSAHTLNVAAELARLGANPHRIACTMYLSYPEAKMRMLAAALQNLRVEKPLAWMWVSAADMTRSGAREEDAEGLVNYALGMDGVEVAAFFRPTAGGYRVSLRSKDGFEVSPIAEEFGGGGHRQASGFSQPGTLEAIMPRVLGRIRASLAAQAGAPRSIPSSAGTISSGSSRRTELDPGTAAAATARTGPSSTGEI